MPRKRPPKHTHPTPLNDPTFPFISTMDSINNNVSGSILAAPDFIFSAKICPSPPHPSFLLFRYHTLKILLTRVSLLSNVNSAKIA
ncbi:hypothetical protein H5410_057143 [Solanum commersonii]|uniref:Uncharacterized protein n=1 Tax=Solanum commersonii TaxID=4109 RepID=A0A9J5WM70_SOLCO|nr:hypothetical protein H5410_057143 [Solanum commersonii]